MLDLLSVTPELFIVLLLAAFCAGCIDSVVGGGGMIQLPALLMAPGFSPVAALSTNKVASAMGTLTSASTYIRSLKIPWKILLPVAFVAFCASAAGAHCATILPAHIFRPAIVVVLAAILVFSVLQPRIPRGPASHAHNLIIPSARLCAGSDSGRLRRHPRGWHRRDDARRPADSHGLRYAPRNRSRQGS